MDELERRQLFERCIDEHHASMYRVAFRLCGCSNTASDLVQEAYFQAWRGLNELQDTQRMRAWLFAILRNQYYKRHRTDRRMEHLTPQTENEFEWATSRHDDAQRNIDERELVQFALDQLDDDYKFPLLLSVMEELKVNEVAEVLEIPAGTVMTRLHRGRKKMKAIIDRQLSAERKSNLNLANEMTERGDHER